MYNVAKVDVVQNGTHIQSVTIASDMSNRTIEHITPWAILQNALDSCGGLRSRLTTTLLPEFDVGQGGINVDGCIQLLLGTQIGPNTDISQLYEPSFIQDMVSKIYSQFGAIIARQCLMESASRSSRACCGQLSFSRPNTPHGAS